MLNRFVDALKEDAAHFRRCATTETSPRLRAVYLSRIRLLETAIDRLILGATFEAIAVRCQNERAKRRR